MNSHKLTKSNNKHLNYWIRNLYYSGKKLRMKLVFVVPEEYADLSEIATINLMKKHGYNLVNIAPGGRRPGIKKYDEFRETLRGIVVREFTYAMELGAGGRFCRTCKKIKNKSEFDDRDKGEKKCFACRRISERKNKREKICFLCDKIFYTAKPEKIYCSRKCNSIIKDWRRGKIYGLSNDNLRIKYKKLSSELNWYSPNTIRKSGKK